MRLVNKGKSRTMRSKHLVGRAVDIHVFDRNGELTWEFPLYEEVANYIVLAAADLGVAVTWGGDWPTLRDGPHFELHDEEV